MRLPRDVVARLFCVFVLVGLPTALEAQSARCRDGSLSYSTSRSGTCSHHGGVAEWLSPSDQAAKSSPAKPAATAPKVPAVLPAGAGTSAQRSAAAGSAFMRQTGYPKGRPGYVVDHIVPLACGGADAAINMQWQTIAKAKDKTERVGCSR
jgi:uncharacterized protein DUF3761